jgi:hypothetical protein
MRYGTLIIVLAALLSTAADAQVRPVFDPDDFLDAREHEFPVFISRLAIGGARGFIDDFRPLHQDVGFLHVANGIYWSRFELDYKRSEVRAENLNPPRHLKTCLCDPPVFFPTAPARDEIPAPPLPAAKDSLQFGWYRTQRGDPADPPVMLRTRLSIARQNVDEDVTFLDTGHPAVRFHGHEQSIGLDAETFFRIGEHSVFGSVLIGRTTRTGTSGNRSQSEVAYISRPPGRSIGKVLVRATLTIGGVTGRGANGLNVINPAFEAFWHSAITDVNVHLIWSPVAMRSGEQGWSTHHQIVLFVDRALYVKLFKPH